MLMLSRLYLQHTKGEQEEWRRLASKAWRRLALKNLHPASFRSAHRACGKPALAHARQAKRIDLTTIGIIFARIAARSMGCGG